VHPDANPSPGGTGSASIRIERNPSPEVWDSYVQSHPDASLFHGTAWQRVLERTFGRYRPCHRLARRGETVCGVLPLYEVPGLPFGRSLVSTPLGVYGGICADDAEATQALLADAETHAREIGARYVELRQERPLGMLPTKELYVYFRYPLHAEHEANWKAIPGKTRRRIRVAEDNGLTYRVGGGDLLPRFYDVYTENMRNLGSPGFPRRLFETLLEEYGTQCMIFGVFLGENMVAGSLMFHFRDRIMPYYSASTPEGLPLSANNFMYWKMTCHGVDRGLRVFDFGRSKKDSGSYHFKRHWGCTPIPLPYQYQLVGQRAMPNLSPNNPKFSLAIRAWQRMPLRVAQWLGPKLAPYFP